MNQILPVAKILPALLQKTDQVLQRIPANYFTAWLFIFQGLLIYGDLITGPWIPFGIFYLLTLYICIKYVSVNIAYLMAFIVVFGKTWVRVKHFPDEILWWQLCWQFVSSLSIYALFCYLINNELTARHAAQNAAAKANRRAGDAERKLLRISEETQQRIGRELHDDLGQQLTGIAFLTQALLQKLKDAQFRDIHEAERIPQMLNQSIAKVRDIAHGLCPAELEEPELHDMLRKLARNIEAAYHVECVVNSATYAPFENNQEISTHLFRIAQEAVNNAIKHGHATHIALNTTLLPSAFILEIADNGNGIQQRESEVAPGLGIRSMRYRAELIGASLSISPRIGKCGAQVMINMPINQQPSET